MTAYYNEIDPYAAEWLRNLIAAGHIAPGEVDERSIADISADDLKGFTQCHFFAGIGIWSHALRRAGWPDNLPIWTGSCPCQPFSNAGQKKGFNDERHLWPIWFNLIDECRPSIIVGEQVASALAWIDLVSADLERTGYAFGAADLCAAGFDGAHIRQRLYFVAVGDTYYPRSQGWASLPERADKRPSSAYGMVGGMADAAGRDASAKWEQRSWEHRLQQEICCTLREDSGGARNTEPVGMANTNVETSIGRRIQGSGQSIDSCEGATFERSKGLCENNRTSAPLLRRTSVDWLFCRDGKWRPVEPGLKPLVDAAPARVGRLRAYGNGLDAETAAQFCSAVIEIGCGLQGRAA